mmetsp:Transcript_13271/g.17475  ORF Transcript_13271/g.17475 Transcript_13271/m.17475 type:complete len:207 (+) Transcript_13271:788-1408(+)
MQQDYTDDSCMDHFTQDQYTAMDAQWFQYRATTDTQSPSVAPTPAPTVTQEPPTTPSVAPTPTPTVTQEPPTTPNVAPTPAPIVTQEPSPGVSQVCKDSLEWIFINGRGKEKKCEWVSMRPNRRCEKVGSLDDQSVSANDACLVACDQCPGDCSDSKTWIFTTFRGQEKKCSWVAGKAWKRCSKIGVDNGESISAREACPKACNEC